MPTYSYRCTECDNAFDIHQAFTDDSLTVCDVCGAPLRKLFNTIGVTFNGSGFYRTDSRGEGDRGGSKGTTASDASGSGGSTGSSGSSGSSDGGTTSGGSSAASTPSSAPVAG
jgi:putative FmdB family regulatory protein